MLAWRGSIATYRLALTGPGKPVDQGSSQVGYSGVDGWIPYTLSELRPRRRAGKATRRRPCSRRAGAPALEPLPILSVVPCARTTECADLGDGRTLIASRGIGAERGDSRRMRFLCRPEIMVIDLAPQGALRVRYRECSEWATPVGGFPSARVRGGDDGWTLATCLSKTSWPSLA